MIRRKRFTLFSIYYIIYNVIVYNKAYITFSTIRQCLVKYVEPARDSFINKFQRSDDRWPFVSLLQNVYLFHGLPCLHVTIIRFIVFNKFIFNKFCSRHYTTGLFHKSRCIRCILCICVQNSTIKTNNYSKTQMTYRYYRR